MSSVAANAQFSRTIGLRDGTLLVAGNMIGSGIFIVSADITRQLGSPAWLLAVWVLAGALTLIAATSYGELAAMFPQAGGQYVYLREAFGPLWAFLYGWTLFLVIQTGTIAAVSVAFAKFAGVLWPSIAPEILLFDAGTFAVAGIGDVSLSLSTQQALAISVTLLLSYVNARGLRDGATIQNICTVAKLAALGALIFFGFSNASTAIDWQDAWRAHNNAGELPGSALLLALAAAMVGALFSSDAWNNVGFTAEEMRQPERNVPLSMALGVSLVVIVYVLTNLAYLHLLPLSAIQNAPHDRVGIAAAAMLMGASGERWMAIAIMIATFGCMNGMILAGARVYYSMARDGLFFGAVGTLNRARVPGVALLVQALWIIVLTLPRTYDATTHAYSNLYGNLLDYIIFGVLVFYILTIASIFVLRRTQAERARPVRAWAYPVLPAVYIVVASAICIALLIAPTTRINALMGLLVIATGFPAYVFWRRLQAK